MSQGILALCKDKIDLPTEPKNIKFKGDDRTKLIVKHLIAGGKIQETMRKYNVSYPKLKSIMQEHGITKNRQIPVNKLNRDIMGILKSYYIDKLPTKLILSNYNINSTYLSRLKNKYTISNYKAAELVIRARGLISVTKAISNSDSQEEVVRDLLNLNEQFTTK